MTAMKYASTHHAKWRRPGDGRRVASTESAAEDIEEILRKYPSV
jgi:hypothetical protein